MTQRFPDDPRPWTVVQRKYLHNRPPWLVMRQEHLRLPNGRDISEYWISEFPPWVSVVALTKDDQVVMVRQYRPALADVHFEIPAGVADPGEDLESAARRELAEETGFGGGRWRLLLQLSANPALQNNLSYTYLAEGVERVAEPSPDTTEDLRVHLVKVAELRALIDAGDVIQALHAAPLLRYLLDRAG